MARIGLIYNVTLFFVYICFIFKKKTFGERFAIVLCRGLSPAQPIKRRHYVLPKKFVILCGGGGWKLFLFMEFF